MLGIIIREIVNEAVHGAMETVHMFMENLTWTLSMRKFTVALLDFTLAATDCSFSRQGEENTLRVGRNRL